MEASATFFSYLDNVRYDDLEAPDDHGLGRWDPAHRLGHENTAQDTQDSLLHAEQPGGGAPVLEERSGVQTEDTNDGDDEATHCEPEHEDTVVDVSELSGDDADPGGEEGNCQSKAETNHVIGLLHTCVIIIVIISIISVVVDMMTVIREQCWRSRYDHHSTDQTSSETHPAHV